MSPLTPSPLSRRQWLKSSGLVAGGALATGTLDPARLAALGADAAPHVLDGQTTAAGFAAHERMMAALRRADGPIRLASNENPYGMAPSARQAIEAGWKQHAWYGAPSLPNLRKVYAQSVGVPEDHVLVLAGSSELLSIAVIAYGLKGEVLTAWPTFEGLPRYAESMGLRVHKVPLDANLAHDLEAMDKRLVQAVDLVFVCNPNNPTGTLTDNRRLRQFVSSAARRAMVIVDEAYHDFVDDPDYSSCIDMVKAGENVIISRTASKIHGLAGLRTGFVIARPDIIARLSAASTSAPGVLGALGAAASIQDTAYQTMCKQRNAEGRAIMRTALQQLGRRMTNSQTNFVFFHAGMPVEKVQAAMLAKGFMVGRAFPPYNDWVRVSVGTPEEMKQVAAVLPGVLAGAAKSMGSSEG
ncbi:MAG: histidinol-phosphate aminotransferase family protein [Gemmatimonadetes bacterium]|nr:histidinol-phosphate aminotransferase family protein [Gemmatimonadota bacterium]